MSHFRFKALSKKCGIQHYLKLFVCIGFKVLFIQNFMAEVPYQFHEMPKKGFGEKTHFSLAGSTGFINQYEESRLANNILRKIYQFDVIEKDAWVQDSLATLLNRTNSVAKNEPLYKTLVMDNKDINAFATPGGIVAVNKGLIIQANNVDELMGVLAHEVAHISQQHFFRRAETFKADNLVLLGGFLSAILLSKENRELVNAMLIGSQAVVADNHLKYSRTQEKEADRMGMQIMAKAGFNAEAMASFFYHLGRYQGYGTNVPEFLLTHPLTKRRLSDAQLHAKQFPFQKNDRHTFASKEFFFLKWQLKIDEPTVKAYKNNTLTFASKDEQAAIQLGLVTYFLNSADKNRYKKAQKLINQLDASYSNHSLTLLLQAKLLVEQLKLTEAEQTLKTALLLYPSSRAIRLALADVLRLQGTPSKAMRILKEKLPLHKNDLAYWQALDKTASDMPKNDINKIASLRYYAEVLFWKNQITSAVVVLDKATELAKEKPSLLAKINKRKAEIKQHI